MVPFELNTLSQCVGCETVYLEHFENFFLIKKVQNAFKSARDFFNNSVVDIWNSLPAAVVLSHNVSGLNAV